MLLILVDPSGPDEACWRYAYQVPTQEQLDELRKELPGTFATEVCLVFFEGDHDTIHQVLDRKFIPYNTEPGTVLGHLRVIRGGKGNEG